MRVGLVAGKVTENQYAVNDVHAQHKIDTGGEIACARVCVACVRAM